MNIYLTSRYVLCPIHEEIYQQIEKYLKESYIFKFAGFTLYSHFPAQEYSLMMTYPVETMMLFLGHIQRLIREADAQILSLKAARTKESDLMKISADLKASIDIQIDAFKQYVGVIYEGDYLLKKICHLEFELFFWGMREDLLEGTYHRKHVDHRPSPYSICRMFAVRLFPDPGEERMRMIGAGISKEELDKYELNLLERNRKRHYLSVLSAILVHDGHWQKWGPQQTVSFALSSLTPAEFKAVKLKAQNDPTLALKFRNIHQENFALESFTYHETKLLKRVLKDTRSLWSKIVLIVQGRQHLGLCLAAYLWSIIADKSQITLFFRAEHMPLISQALSEVKSELLDEEAVTLFNRMLENGEMTEEKASYEPVKSPVEIVAIVYKLIHMLRMQWQHVYDHVEAQHVKEWHVLLSDFIAHREGKLTLLYTDDGSSIFHIWSSRGVCYNLLLHREAERLSYSVESPSKSDPYERGIIYRYAKMFIAQFIDAEGSCADEAALYAQEELKEEVSFYREQPPSLLFSAQEEEKEWEESVLVAPLDTKALP